MGVEAEALEQPPHGLRIAHEQGCGKLLEDWQETAAGIIVLEARHRWEQAVDQPAAGDHGSTQPEGVDEQHLASVQRRAWPARRQCPVQPQQPEPQQGGGQRREGGRHG